MNFEDFYKTWFSRVKYFAYEYIKSEEEAENIAQDVFIEIYNKNILSDSNINILSYLFTCVKNKSINYLNHKMVELNAISSIQEEYRLELQMKYDSLEIFSINKLEEEDISTLIDKALKTLPIRCREIIIRKIDGKKTKDIAEELNISVKTVENQVSIGYRKIKEELKYYIPLLFFLLHN